MDCRARIWTPSTRGRPPDSRFLEDFGSRPQQRTSNVGNPSRVRHFSLWRLLKELPRPNPHGTGASFEDPTGVEQWCRPPTWLLNNS